MLMRLIGLTCCAGICQPCITLVEVSIVCGGVLLAVFIRQIAIVTCGILLFAAGYAVYKKFIDKDDPNEESNDQASASPAAAAASSAAPANGSSPSEKMDTTTPVESDEENPSTKVSVVASNASAPGLGQTSDAERPPPTNPDYVVEAVEVTK